MLKVTQKPVTKKHCLCERLLVYMFVSIQGTTVCKKINIVDALAVTLTLQIRQ